MIIGKIILSFLLAGIVHLFGMAITSLLLKIPVKQVSVGCGPRLITYRQRGVDWSLSLIPCGGYVSYQDENTLKNLSVLKYITIVIPSLLALFLVAVTFCGLQVSIHYFLRGFEQLVTAPLSPQTIGAELLKQLYAFFENNSLYTGIGLVSAKMLAYHMLPLPYINGGDIILHIARRSLGISQRIQNTIATISLVLVLMMTFSWLYALYSALSS